MSDDLVAWNWCEGCGAEMLSESEDGWLVDDMAEGQALCPDCRPSPGELDLLLAEARRIPN